MTKLYYLIRRNCKVFFSDNGMFFTSLIIPAILLVLYTTFLAKVYKDSFLSALPAGFVIDEALIDATVGGQLISSLLAVSCVTVSFCSNLLMVQDRVRGARNDLTVSPVKGSTLAVGYFAASAAVTLIVNLSALAVCFVFLAKMGWYMSFADVFAVILDVILLTLFGTALSSCINFPLKTNGQASAVGTIVSSGYGFICGVYMPISSFPAGLQKVISFLPGTYGTSLIRSHSLAGVFAEMEKVGFPSEAIAGIKSAIDCKIKFFGHDVKPAEMYAVLCGSILLFTALYILLNVISRKRNK